MRVAVTGANGQLGSDLCAELESRGATVIALTHAEVEIEDPASVDSAVAASRPDAIVNTAAMHHLARCEDDPARALSVNTLGVRNICRAAAKVAAHVVQISTDYVFDGNARRPYVESDHTAPLNVYGVLKFGGRGAS